MSKHSAEVVNLMQLEEAPSDHSFDHDVTYLEDVRRRQYIAQQLAPVAIEGLSVAGMGERRPNAEIEAGLKKAIIGQDGSIEAVIAALNRSELHDPNKPYSVILLAGPSGTGKSQLVKEFAKLKHGSEKEGLLAVDCQLHSSGYTLNTLIGAPPGYIGREQRATYDSKIFEKDGNVVLYDEIEKSSAEFQNHLLGILDNATIRLNNKMLEKDEHGKDIPNPDLDLDVRFNKSYIFLTTNVGANEMMQQLSRNPTGFSSSNTPATQTTERDIKKAVMDGLKNRFSPELLNRIDSVAIFETLSDDYLKQALEVHIEKANEHYRDKYGMKLSVSPELITEIVASTELRKQLGIRQVQHTYNRMVESKLAERFTTGGIPVGSRVRAVTLREQHEIESNEPAEVQFYYKASERLLEEYNEAQARRQRRIDAGLGETVSKALVLANPTQGQLAPEKEPEDKPETD